MPPPEILAIIFLLFNNDLRNNFPKQPETTFKQNKNIIT